MTPARQAAAAAFAELDTIDRRCLSNFDRHHADLDRKEHALWRLALAMNAEFGPLPDGVVILTADVWRDE